jgi:hypothetical protein
MTGSHIDTQPTGGKFGGNYGVLAGIEVVRTPNDHGIETEAHAGPTPGPAQRHHAGGHPPGPQRHDFHPLQRRHQPQRN